MILGNLLEQALRILPAVMFEHRYFLGELKNEIGIKVPTYSGWTQCRGMVQPVQRSKYEALGLDFAKDYINVWGSIPLHSVGLQNQPDQLRWNGFLFTITAVNEWNQYNGWVNVTAAQDKRESGLSGAKV